MGLLHLSRLKYKEDRQDLIAMESKLIVTRSNNQFNGKILANKYQLEVIDNQVHNVSPIHVIKLVTFLLSLRLTTTMLERVNNHNNYHTNLLNNMVSSHNNKLLQQITDLVKEQNQEVTLVQHQVLAQLNCISHLVVVHKYLLHEEEVLKYKFNHEDLKKIYSN